MLFFKVKSANRKIEFLHFMSENAIIIKNKGGTL